MTSATARRLGMTRSGIAYALHTGLWQTLARGVYLTVPGQPTRADWINVGLEVAGATAALSGWDAVRLVGVGATTPPRPQVLVLTRSGDHRSGRHVHIRRTNRAYDLWTVGSEHPDLAFTPVAAPARAVADTALQYRNLAPVRALVTSAVQRDICQIEDLLAEVHAGPRNGSAHLRRAVEDAIGGARSVAEAEAIDVLTKAPVPEFEANVPIIDQHGRLLAVADMLWRALRAVAEIDSREFHFNEADWKRTMTRHNQLMACGLAVAHYPPSLVRTSGAAWALDVARWLRARADELGVIYQPANGRRNQRGVPEPFVVSGLPR